MTPVLLAEGGGSSGIVAGALAGLDMTVVTTEFVSVIPIVLPVALTFLAIRKGMNFFLGTLRGV